MFVPDENDEPVIEGWPWSVLERQTDPEYHPESAPETSLETLNWNVGDQVVLLALTTAGVRVHVEGPIESVTPQFDVRMTPTARSQYWFEFRDGLRVLVRSWMARNRTQDGDDD